MGIFSGLFKSRDKPQNRTSGSGYSFFFGGSTAGKNVNERSAMQMTAVYSCVRILAEAVAGLPLHLYRYKEDGGKEKALDHPLYHLLHDEPNPEMSSFVFRETLMTHLLLWGNAYAQIIRNGKGEVIALYPLMPNRMVVDRDTKGRLYYQYTTSTEDAPTMKGVTVNLPPSDVLHIPGLGFDGLVGYSPIAMAKNAIGMAIACEEYGAKFFANGAAPGGVLEHPGTIKDPQRVRESWQSTFGGSANSNKIAVLEEGMKYTPIGISPEQAQFLETRKFQVNEIARIFRVPPHMVGDLEKSSFSNIEQQSLEFVKYTLDPWVIRWEQTIHRSLLLPDEKSQYFVKFNLEGLLRGDYQSRITGTPLVGRTAGCPPTTSGSWRTSTASPPRRAATCTLSTAICSRSRTRGLLQIPNLTGLPQSQGLCGKRTSSEVNELFTLAWKRVIWSLRGRDGKEENADEEFLEVEESSPDGDGSGGTDAVSERHHRRGKLV